MEYLNEEEYFNGIESNTFSPRTAISTIGLYPMSRDQVRDFSFDLWETTFTDKFTYAIVGNPIDAILGLKWYYGLKSSYKLVGTSVYVKVGNVAFDGGFGSQTKLITKPLASEYLTFDCGEVSIPGGSSKNSFSPYKKYEMYIPFVGFVDLDPEDLFPYRVPIAFMGNTIPDPYANRLFLSYRVNLMTGAAIATVSILVNTSGRHLDRPENIILLQIPCEMGVDIPMNVQAVETGLSRAATITAGAVSGGIGIMASVATRGATAPLTAGMVANAGSESLAGDIQSGVSGTVNSILPNQLPSGNYRRSGGMTGDTSSLVSMIPYVTVTSRMMGPDSSNITGEPDYRTVKLDELEKNGRFIRAGGLANGDSRDIPKAAMDEISRILHSGLFIGEIGADYDE